MTTKSTSTHRMREARQRAGQGLVALESPHSWLGVHRASQLAAEAYRIASYSARHVQARDVPDDDPDGEDAYTTDGVSMNDMRERFVQDFAEVFRDLVFFEAAERIGCLAWDRQAIRDVANAWRTSVPDTWAPELPQFGTPELGKVSLRKAA